MSPTAIVMLLGSGLMLWGGLAWSLLRLRKHPDLPDENAEVITEANTETAD